MIRAARHFLRLLIVVGLVAGGFPARAAAPVSAMPCAMMALGMTMAAPRPAPPCKNADGRCLDQVSCAVAAGLPARAVSAEPAVPSGSVSYWSAWRKLAGLARQPEPLPPRTA